MATSRGKGRREAGQECTRMAANVGRRTMKGRKSVKTDFSEHSGRTASGVVFPSIPRCRRARHPTSLIALSCVLRLPRFDIALPRVSHSTRRAGVR